MLDLNSPNKLYKSETTKDSIKAVYFNSTFIIILAFLNIFNNCKYNNFLPFWLIADFNSRNS